MSLRARLGRAIAKLRGSGTDYDLREERARLVRIQALGPELSEVSDDDLRGRAARLREQARAGRSLDELAVEAFALVREVAERKIGLRPYDVQILAGLALHRGRVVEMATGEGKTLAAVAAVWLHSLTGEGAHVLTFNDYLARRDAAWMGPIYEFLGASVGVIQESMSRDARAAAYACDVTYATAKECGFDYLRDHLATDVAQLVHRPFHFALVDEADSVLIDEARVPLVIAGDAMELPVDPRTLTEIATKLDRDDHYELDENGRNVALTEEGVHLAEETLGIPLLHESEHRDVLTALNLALHAQVLLRRDVDYIVRDGRIEVVDEFTGRVVDDRRWPDGLHPALEAKEGLPVRPEGRILASIALQHFLPLYPELCGMTATAQPAADELQWLYHLNVSVIEPNRPSVRLDEPDEIFTDRESKLAAVMARIRAVHETARPILVGTASVAESESLAATLRESGIECRVLNARNDEQEAAIIADAGRLSVVTISTNMAGRGTDIKLGGADESQRDEVVALGGLYLIGTNKHESRRIDDQLRGRAGRQGDPGNTKFFISLQDDLMVRYGIDRELLPLLESERRGRVDDDRLRREVDRAQRIVEAQNFEIRQTLWKYSGMVEAQRILVTDEREQTLRHPESLELLATQAHDRWQALAASIPADVLHRVEQQITLYHTDQHWMRHLAFVADVREGIHLRTLGAQDTFGGLMGLRKTPLADFHESVVAGFAGMQQERARDIVSTFRTADVTADGIDLAEAGLKGPESTWTYIINDSPFESTLIRLWRKLSHPTRR